MCPAIFINQGIAIFHSVLLEVKEKRDLVRHHGLIWLNYEEASNSVIYFYCCQVSNRNLPMKGLYGRHEEAFITKGFINWKDACASFRKHETSKSYIEAVQAIAKRQHNVDEIFSQVHSKQKKINGYMLLSILQNVQFLSRQGLA